jgi:dienelactone hydrolase
MQERLRDVQVAVSYLTGRTDIVDPARIGTLGTSAGGSFAVALAGYDVRIRAFVGVCGGFFGPASVGEDARRQLLANVERHRAYFENRITSISMMNFDFVSPAGWMGDRAGLLIAGTDDVYVPAAGTAEDFDRLTGPKDLITVDGVNHIAFYDQEPYVSTAVDAAPAWYRDYL